MLVTETVRGREEMVRLVSDIEQQLGRRVLLVAGLDEAQTRLHTAMPEAFGSADYHGRDTSSDRRLQAFAPTVPDSAILLALAFATGKFSGAGAHVEYTAPSRPTQDLMSRHPDALMGSGKVFLVDSVGWRPDDTQVKEKPDLGEPLLYRWPHENTDSIAVLGAVIVSPEDLARPVRPVADPRLEYPKDQL